ncbi:MAG: COX15/CtaA family protein [Verrucomicrobiales bacterium]|nr:COX15/CtaA family protein [Verrucomicrobiales bacterium]
MSKTAPNKSNPWLFRFAILTAFVTFLLIGLGGLVTSHGAGMSVPDWPNTYGYNMFTFPISKWVGGIFYEHTHRLLASAVGLLTTVLAVWLWLADTRKWMHWLGLAALLGVIAQGILGGLRVTMRMDSLGVFHATIAQLFFILICAMTLFTSRFWIELAGGKRAFFVSRSLRTLVLATTFLIFAQLIIAATMRHQHAGLAIADFPLAYGKIWPATNPTAVASYNARRVSVTEEAPVTAFQIKLQMAHRVVALAIFILVAACAWQAWRRLGGKDSLAKLAIFWLALMFAQIALGAWTIWSNKAADVATLHVMVGALSLVTGALWCIIGFGRSAASLPDAQTSGVFGVQTSMLANK